jgi:hypothetical protein
MRALTCAILLATAGSPLSTLRAQPPGPNCLHSAAETPDQRDRRLAAIAFTRKINTGEASTFVIVGRYVAITDPSLQSLPQPPSGFVAQVVTDGNHYSLWLTDRTDACRLAIVSNESGVIYRADPIGL